MEILMLTQGEFFLALANWARQHRGDTIGVGKVLIGLHANKYGIDVDDDGPYDERDIIVVPLEKFLKAVRDDVDMLYVAAHACIAWEAYQKYQAAKDDRLALARQREEHMRYVTEHPH